MRKKKDIKNVLKFPCWRIYILVVGSAWETSIHSPMLCSTLSLSTIYDDDIKNTQRWLQYNKKCPSSFFLLSRILRRLSSSVDVIITSPMRDNVKLFQLTHLLSYLDYMFVHKKEKATHNQLSKLSFDSSVGLKEWGERGKDKKTRACFEFAVGRVSWRRKSCVLYVEIDNRVKIEESRETTTTQNVISVSLYAEIQHCHRVFGFCLHRSRVELRTNDI